MTSRAEAFRRQAASDLREFGVLTLTDLPDCHALHYLQMASEKLGKAIRTAGVQAGANEHSHVALTKALRLIRNSRAAAAALTPGNRRQLAAVVGACLPLAQTVERLAPTLAPGPNPEYPWPVGRSRRRWVVPAEHEFPVAARVRGPEWARLLALLRRTLERLDRVFVN